MTDLEFLKHKRDIDNKHKLAMQILYSKFIKENRKFKHGAVLQDKHGNVFVLNQVTYTQPFGFGNPHNVPMLTYRGLKLTKQLRYRKDDDTMGASGDEITELNVNIAEK